MRHLLPLLLLLFPLSSLAQEERKQVVLETTMGDIRIALYNETPLHRDNFLKMVRLHVYDSLLFHRVISDFIIQAGDPGSKYAKPGDVLGNGDFDFTVPAEFRAPEIRHKRGAVGMAREGDNVNPDRASSACQFYIVWGKTEEGTPHLDGGYTVFGEVVEGMDVVDAIRNFPTDDNDRPLTDVRIIKALLLEKNGAK